MSQFIYLPPTQASIIRTQMIDHAAARILSAHAKRGQFALIVGRSGAGKTTAARYMAQAFSEDCDQGAPNGFRARHYTCTEMRVLYEQALERHLLSEMLTKGLGIRIGRDLRQYRAADLQRLVLNALRDQGVQMLFIDEAGMIPVLGLNMLANLLNEADMAGDCPLTLVLVGMHHLPLNVRDLPQLDTRAQTTINFAPVNATEAVAALALAHPFFQTLDMSDPEVQTDLKWMLSQDVTGGLLGKVIKLAEKAAKYAGVTGEPFNFEVIRDVQMMERAESNRAMRDATRGYRGALETLDDVADEATVDAHAQGLRRRASGRKSQDQHSARRRASGS